MHNEVNILAINNLHLTLDKKQGKSLQLTQTYGAAQTSKKIPSKHEKRSLPTMLAGLQSTINSPCSRNRRPPEVQKPRQKKQNNFGVETA